MGRLAPRNPRPTLAYAIEAGAMDRMITMRRAGLIEWTTTLEGGVKVTYRGRQRRGRTLAQALGSWLREIS